MNFEHNDPMTVSRRPEALDVAIVAGTSESKPLTPRPFQGPLSPRPHHLFKAPGNAMSPRPLQGPMKLPTQFFQTPNRDDPICPAFGPGPVPVLCWLAPDRPLVLLTKGPKQNHSEGWGTRAVGGERGGGGADL